MSLFDSTPSSELHKAVERAAAAQARQRHEIIERACEEALQGGEHGVLVTPTGPAGDIRAEVSPDVPYGWIHYRSPLPLANAEWPMRAPGGES